MCIRDRFTIVAGMLIGLIGRLMYIEYTSGEKYEKIVLSQQEYDSKVIPYQRGDIVDAKMCIRDRCKAGQPVCRRIHRNAVHELFRGTGGFLGGGSGTSGR